MAQIVLINSQGNANLIMMGLKPLEKRPYANLEINATEVTNVDFFMNHP